jgi:hypothetical protein
VAFSLPHNLPVNKSPHQSPHVVIPSHHILMYLLIRRKERLQRRGDSSTRGKWRRSMSETHASTEDHGEPGLYEIRIQGHLDDRWVAWFGDLTLTREDNGETLLTGPVVDQAALHGLLRKVRDLAMPLISVIRVRPGQDDT